MPSPCLPHPPRPSVFCSRYPGNPMGGMQIRGTSEAAAPCLPSQFALMMTNTFVHGEGRWELQSASHHCPSKISFYLCNPTSSSGSLYSFLFTCVPPFFFIFIISFIVPVIFGLIIFDPWRVLHSSLTADVGFARGQCYLNRPIGLFAIAPSIKQEAPRIQPITSISRDSIR